MTEILIPNTKRPGQIIAIEVTIRACATGETTQVSTFVPAPVELFVKHLLDWTDSLVWVRVPPIPTATLNETVMRRYCIMYAGYFEEHGDGDELTEYRTKLWRAFRDQFKDSAHPIKPGKQANTARHNFIDCLEAFLTEWKKRKAVSPYASDG